MSESSESQTAELQRRLVNAEAALRALREGQVDAIVGREEALVVRLAQAEAREAHVQQVLRAIRTINRLIAHEYDTQRLIEQACAVMTQNMGYFNAWIAVLDGAGAQVVATAASGLEGEFDQLRDRLYSGEYPECMRLVLQSTDMVVQDDPPVLCPECPLSVSYSGRAGLSGRLVHEGRLYGVLSVSVPGGYGRDAEELALFGELVDDLAFALHKIEAAERLRLTTINLKEAIRAGNVGLWDWDLVANTVHYSPEWKRQIGYEDHEIGDGLDEWERRVHPDDLGPTYARVQQAIRENTCGYNVEFRFRHKDGSYRWILAQASVLCNAQGKPVRTLGSHIDITARKESEAESERLREHLAQAQKMETVGVLAGGIAHEFNNLLQVIQGYNAMALEDVEPDSELWSNLEEVQKAATRATGLVKDLLAFSRRQILEVEDVDLHDVVTGMLPALRQIIGKGIVLEVQLGARQAIVGGDSRQIGQILEHLFANACEAMPDGGTLTLETGIDAFDSAFCADHGWARPGEYARLTVYDTGVGMHDKTLARAFEPFFTTKEVGQGAGLGLAGVYGLVKQHQGLIHVDTAVGQGTTVRIYLPLRSHPANTASSVDP